VIIKTIPPVFFQVNFLIPILEGFYSIEFEKARSYSVTISTLKFSIAIHAIISSALLSGLERVPFTWFPS